MKERKKKEKEQSAFDIICWVYIILVVIYLIAQVIRGHLLTGCI